MTLLRAQLPFALTGAQERVIAEALADLRSGRLMNRLVQGDVGSGKTLVGAFVAYQVIAPRDLCGFGSTTTNVSPGTGGCRQRHNDGGGGGHLQVLRRGASGRLNGADGNFSVAALRDV